MKRKDKKSVLFVINTMGRAGAERALISLLNSIEKERLDICLYVIIPRGELFAEIPENVRILNKKTHSGSVLSPGGSVFIGKLLLKSALKKGVLADAFKRYKAVGGMEKGEEKNQKREKILRRMLVDGAKPLEKEYDLAVAYIEGPAAWFTAEKVKAKKKAAFIHVDYSRAGYDRSIDMNCYSRFDAVFMVSEDVKNSFLKVYPEYRDKSFLFFNIIDREMIEARAKEETVFEDDGYFKILTVGRLHYQKGYDTAVETAVLLDKAGKKFRWYVLGEGPERRNISALIAEKGLEDKFLLLGAKSNPYPYFKGADLYVCTSRFEGKSIVIEEAQALGKPIAAAECTGIREQITSGSDGVITDRNPENLAREIINLMDNDSLREKYSKASLNKNTSGGGGMEVFLKLLE